MRCTAACGTIKIKFSVTMNGSVRYIREEGGARMTLEALYKEHYGVVYGYLLSLCGDPAGAEDLAAETFLRGFRQIHRYDGRCKPSTWLCAIGKNLYFSECRRNRRLTPLWDSLPAESFFEEAIADRAEAHRILQLAKQLPELRRQVFFMRVWGLPFREIGSALGQSETWARVTYFRIKAAILEELEDSHETM